MNPLLFDLETELIVKGGRLPRIHCMVYTRDGEDYQHVIGHDEVRSWWVQTLKQRDEKLLIGHNIARFDIPVLEQWLCVKFTHEMYDTLVASRMTHQTTLLARSSAMRNASGKDERERELAFPKRHLRSHALEAWGYRFRQRKKFTDVDTTFWEKFSPEMLERCQSDVRLNWRLYQWLLGNGAKQGWPPQPEDRVRFESRIAYIVGYQERHGFGFNTAAAKSLERELQGERADLEVKLKRAFSGWYAPRSGQKGEEHELPDGPTGTTVLRGPGEAMFSVTRQMNRRPNTSVHPHPWPADVGGAHTKIAWVEFNPASAHHRGIALARKHGWVPDAEEYTDGGIPETSEKVLKKLDYPEIPDLLAYLRVNKMLGQLSEGTNSWLNLVKEDKIYGSVNVVGTRTMRMTHSAPNVAQTDKDPRMRELWKPTGKIWGGAVQLGVDASGLELRCLGHRLAPWDGGATAEAIIDGDVHSEWQALTGLYFRRNQKTFSYAMLYGAGAEKLGQTVLTDLIEAKAEGLVDEVPGQEYVIELGKAAKDRLMEGLPALKYLNQKLENAFERGYLKGIDGHLIVCSSRHGVLNDLLQSDGALVMKHALRRFWGTMGDTHGKSWAFLANVHDEWQMEVSTEAEAERIGKFAVQCIVGAGVDLGFRCPLDGEYQIGKTWRETH